MEDSHFHCADPDFRRNPKTDRFCWHCQRDLKIGVGYKIFVSKEFVLNLIHKEYKDLYEHYECLIGPECAKHIPLDFIVIEKHEK